MKVKEFLKLIAFPFLACGIALFILVFGDPTPEEEDR